MNHKKIIITIIILFFVLIVGLYIYAFTIPGITGALTSTYIVQNDSVKTSYDVDCVVVRNETVYFSDHSGNIEYYISEGEKTRINTRVLDIYSSDKHGVYCKKTGFVSYYYDGYEQTLTPDTIKDMNPSSYLSIENTSESKVSNTVTKGDYIYKLVDGSAWYLMIPVTDDQLSSFKMGSSMNIQLDDAISFTAVAERILGDEAKVVMAKVTSYYPDFAKYRRLQVKVITSETNGLRVPNTAITKNVDGNEGVYVLGTDGEYHFTRIKVLLVDGDYSLIRENEFTEYYEDNTSKIISSVRLYDEIKRNADN